MADVKTREDLCRMTMREIRAYAKQIGCCLGYAGARKDSAIREVVDYQRHLSRAAETAERGQ